MNASIVAARGLAALRAQASAGADRVGAVPDASSLRPGSVVLSLSGPQRSELRTTVVLTAAALFVAGGTVGYLVRGRNA